MNVRSFVVISAIVAGVAVACVGLGWFAGRSGAQQMAGLSEMPINGTEVSDSSGRRLIEPRVHIYLGDEISEEPLVTIAGGRVYPGSQIGRQPFLTLENKHVYSGGSSRGPLLYKFEGDRVMEAGAREQIAFVQDGDKIRFGPDPQAPTLFTFENSHVYWGERSEGRILATSNTDLAGNPDLVKLVTVVLYMEVLE